MTCRLVCHDFSVKSKDGLSLSVTVSVQLSADIKDSAEIFVRDGVVRLYVANTLNLLSGKSETLDARRTSHITQALHDLFLKVSRSS